VVREGLQYYSYSLSWLRGPACFLLAGNADGHGFAMLLDSAGKTRARWIACLRWCARPAWR
jgi:hypothetical protein